MRLATEKRDYEVFVFQLRETFKSSYPLGQMASLQSSVSDIRKLIERYFLGMKFVRVDQKGDLYVYAAEASGMLTTGHRCIFLLVPTIYQTPDKVDIEGLPWKVIQTRIVKKDYPRVRPTAWQYPRNLPDYIFHVRERTDSSSTYTCPGEPGEITLLHDPKKKTKLQYRDKMSLIGCLETFHCVFALPEDLPGPPPPGHIRVDDSFHLV